MVFIRVIFVRSAYFLRDSPLCIVDSSTNDRTDGLKYQNLGCGAYTALSGMVLAGLCVAFSRHQDCDTDDFNWIFWLFGFSVITTVVGKEQPVSMLKNKTLLRTDNIGYSNTWSGVILVSY